MMAGGHRHRRGLPAWPVSTRVRPFKAIPRSVLALLAAGLVLQLAWHALRPGPTAEARELPVPPSVQRLELMSLGDPLVMGRVLMLWLQAFDNQPGISIPFRSLDYPKVSAWLGRILDLDPHSQYPLMAASRLYGEVNDAQKQRLMLEFVYARFLEAPNRRWRWLAHAAIIAKHRLRDLPLALRYARAITEHALGPEVPYWARDMSVMVLEDMGELEAARILVGGLLDSGAIVDARELRFLQKKLDELQARSVENSTTR